MLNPLYYLIEVDLWINNWIDCDNVDIKPNYILKRNGSREIEV